jgi:hypothetical protein
MRYALSILLVMSSTAWVAEAAQYLPSIQQRWDASELVCTGYASPRVRTGLTRTIDGRDRDQLSTEVKLETCFKGDRPTASEIRVLGYDVVAMKDVGQGYSGPPTGFVSKGRNLLFLHRTQNSDEFEVAVPVYDTSIRLADARPDNTSVGDQQPVRLVLAQELEAALVQFDDVTSAISRICLTCLECRKELPSFPDSRRGFRSPFGAISLWLFCSTVSRTPSRLSSLFCLTRPHRCGNARTPRELLANMERRPHLHLSNKLRPNPQQQMI